MDKRKGEEGRGGGLFHTHVKLGEFRYNGYLYARLESVALCKHGDRGRGGNEFSRRIHAGNGCYERCPIVVSKWATWPSPINDISTLLRGVVN